MRRSQPDAGEPWEFVMALKINRVQIGDRQTIAANATETFRWNNPPSGLVSYFVVASPSTPSGPHGASGSEVSITSVRHNYVKDNYNSDKEWVEVDIKNHAAKEGGYTLWQTWVSE
jgi:hypothetical protein